MLCSFIIYFILFDCSNSNESDFQVYICFIFINLLLNTSICRQQSFAVRHNYKLPYILDVMYVWIGCFSLIAIAVTSLMSND